MYLVFHSYPKRLIFAGNIRKGYAFAIASVVLNSPNIYIFMNFKKFCYFGKMDKKSYFFPILRKSSILDNILNKVHVIEFSTMQS